MSWVSNTILPFQDWPFGTLQNWGRGERLLTQVFWKSHITCGSQPGDDQEY